MSDCSLPSFVVEGNAGVVVGSPVSVTGADVIKSSSSVVESSVEALRGKKNKNTTVGTMSNSDKM